MMLQDQVANKAVDTSHDALDGIALGTLAPLDTICVQTLNNSYRIFLLDPETGRALIEGGNYCAEPVEALVIGSVSSRSRFEPGLIAIGMRIEFWANARLTCTSPVQSFHVETHAPAESPLCFA